MPKIAYTTKKWSPLQLTIIRQANEIISRYAAQGFNLTLRQLYYQFVAADLFPASWADPATGSTNNEKSYGKLGDIISDARMCGLLDWDAIIDRTRSLRALAHWDSPAAIIKEDAACFRYDLWEDQPTRPEVWVEKDAAIGVVENICNRLRVPYFSCRGYTSQSAMHEAAMRLLDHHENNQIPLVIHLGDHDPSGVDMSRDIEDRIKEFLDRHDSDAASNFTFTRIALNLDQVRQYNPPPNPTKATDARCAGYRARFGQECWELDALEPAVVANLIQVAVEAERDDDKWREAVSRERRARNQLTLISDKYEDIVSGLEGGQ